MSSPHANPGEVVDVSPLGAARATTATRPPVKASASAAIRMAIPAGKEIPTHKDKGQLVMRRPKRKTAFTTCGTTHDLEAGHLLYLRTGEPHSLRGTEGGSLRLTIVLPNQ